MYEKMKERNRNEYLEYLNCVCSLSSIFASSDSPYLDYRAAENIFCKAFEAENLSRSDCAIDAKKGKYGIGIKTFLQKNGKTLQKIAEFNKDAYQLLGKEPKEIVKIVSNLRNARLDFAKRVYDVDELIYHCVTREFNKISIFECPMDFINIDKIASIKVSGNNITFRDNLNEYSFNLSKSTLYKRFYTTNPLDSLDVKIINNPLNLINKINTDLEFKSIKEDEEYIILPLYSERGIKNVPGKSGLNQWNAGGRKRNTNEVYIPIPMIIHRLFPNFFPERDIDFVLLLPNGKQLSAKVCQDNSKALMSNPNKDLGDWILRDVLDLNVGQVLTYSDLEKIGLDAVVIYKKSHNVFEINFVEIGSYDDFISDVKGNE